MPSLSPPSFSAGDTFLFKAPSSPHFHLYVTLCEPSGNPPQIIVVPLNTVTFLTDTTTLLSPGDHPFITHTTAVSYDLMELFPISLLEILEQRNAVNNFVRREPMQADVLARIVSGGLISDMAPKRVVQELKVRLGQS
jgi:hypothetical protein